MIRLLFIVPYPELQQKVQNVLEHDPNAAQISADIRVMTVDQTTEIDAEGYDAIIARGFSYRQLQAAHPNMPVIDLTISGYDVIRTVADCRRVLGAKHIAICGFYGKIYDATELCRMLGCEVEFYPSDDYQKLESNIRDAVAQGCDAVIGGYSATALAKSHGVPHMLIRTGEETIQRAIDETVRTVEQVRAERIVAQTYKTIIYASKDGVLYVDAHGMICLRNRVVKAMHNGEKLLHRPLRAALPYLYKEFDETLRSGQEQSGRIYTIPRMNLTVSTAFTPVVVSGKVPGVVITLTDITQIQKLENQIRRTLSEKGLRAKYTFDDIIHSSERVSETIETARKYAASDSNIIIVGETGTGKELFAQSIHNASPRRNGPFVAINCAALPESLLESELFGYVEGSFTGNAKGGKMGLFEQAHNGTLFLDEIGEISMSTQSKLLRVLQEREVRRIGDNKVITVNVRIISATNRSIQQMAGKGLFRRDLMYRLDVLRIFLPPLRQRGRDAELLFVHLLQTRAEAAGTAAPKVEADALEALQGYPFNGNIRELGNIVERASVICSDGVIRRADVTRALYPQDLDAALPSEPSLNLPCSEENAILWALEESGGNHTRAAQLLGIDRSTLWRRMRKYQIKDK